MTSPPLAVSIVISSALQLSLLSAIVLLYVRRVRNLARGRHPVPGWRQTCFYSGFLVLAATITSLDHTSRELVLASTVQQLLLGDIAALLIVLGLTGPLLAPLRGIRLLDRLRVLSNPLIAFPLWAIDLYFWHLSALYRAALEHSGVAAVEQMMFIAFGVNMWMCLLGPLPTPSWFGNLGRLIYIVAVGVTGMLLGNIFMWSGTIFYPFYIHGEALFHISPLADQNLAGAIMLAEQSILTLGLFCWLFLRAARESDERQELLGAPQAGRLELTVATEARTVAAVRAGRDPASQRRLETHPAVGAPDGI